MENRFGIIDLLDMQALGRWKRAIKNKTWVELQKQHPLCFRKLVICSIQKPIILFTDQYNN